MLAIGDLHGDYYKLKRILESYNIAKIQEKEYDVDLEILDNKKVIVFIGDYIDWRGENLENPNSLEYDKLVKGTFFIIKLISKLLEKRDNVYTIIGNHEQMMFDALKFVKKVSLNEIQTMIDNYLEDYYLLIRKYLENQMLDDFLSFSSWYSQGGANTIKAFNNSIKDLIFAVENELLFKKLLMFVHFDIKENNNSKKQESHKKIVFSHSFPDKLDILERILSNSIKEEDVSFIIWGRKIWGIDAFKGGRTDSFSDEELLEALNRNNIDKYVVGHTKVSNEPGPYEFFNGRIINIDNHGTPFSEPLFMDIEVSNPTFCFFKDCGIK